MNKYRLTFLKKERVLKKPKYVDEWIDISFIIIADSIHDALSRATEVAKNFNWELTEVEELEA